MKWTNGTQAGEATGNQRPLRLHLNKDLCPPQHPAVMLHTQRVQSVIDPAKCRAAAVGGGEVDSVFTSLMLCAPMHSKWMDNVFQISNF